MELFSEASGIEGSPLIPADPIRMGWVRTERAGGTPTSIVSSGLRKEFVTRSLEALQFGP